MSVYLSQQALEKAKCMAELNGTSISQLLAEYVEQVNNIAVTENQMMFVRILKRLHIRRRDVSCRPYLRW
jgi:hypothetical protein